MMTTPSSDLPTTVPQDALLLTVKQAAAALQLGTNRVYEMVNAKELPSLRLGGSIRIPRSSLIQWIEDQLAA
ncbi:helix-turn-helix domain-containing protein [Deinococcus metallilatus]|nr:helix-turn-helix domain-containing protein [Deinococcus metallilatus]